MADKGSSVTPALGGEKPLAAAELPRAAGGGIPLCAGPETWYGKSRYQRIAITLNNYDFETRPSQTKDPSPIYVDHCFKNLVKEPKEKMVPEIIRRFFSWPKMVYALSLKFQSYSKAKIKADHRARNRRRNVLIKVQRRQQQLRKQQQLQQQLQQQQMQLQQQCLQQQQQQQQQASDAHGDDYDEQAADESEEDLASFDECEEIIMESPPFEPSKAASISRAASSSSR